MRDGTVIHETDIAELKRFKDDVREVQEGFECGIRLEGFNDVKEGDVLEVYETRQIERTDLSTPAPPRPPPPEPAGRLCVAARRAALSSSAAEEAATALTPTSRSQPLCRGRRLERVVYRPTQSTAAGVGRARHGRFRLQGHDDGDAGRGATYPSARSPVSPREVAWPSNATRPGSLPSTSRLDTSCPARLTHSTTIARTAVRRRSNEERGLECESAGRVPGPRRDDAGAGRLSRRERGRPSRSAARAGIDEGTVFRGLPTRSSRGFERDGLPYVARGRRVRARRPGLQRRGRRAGARREEPDAPLAPRVSRRTHSPLFMSDAST